MTEFPAFLARAYVMPPEVVAARLLVHMPARLTEPRFEMRRTYDSLVAALRRP